MTINLISSDVTPRFSLPRLQFSQAQKELFINETSTIIDALIAPEIEGEISAPPSGEIAPGLCWLIAANPSGEWAGHAGKIALWSGAGWRFIAPRPGLKIWQKTAGFAMCFNGNSWQQGEAVSPPTGGSVIDAEARAAIQAIVTSLQQFGLLKSAN